ncbi:hypothetical protein EK904_011014, partial [Melospiza melodia maxima]
MGRRAVSHWFFESINNCLLFALTGEAGKIPNDRGWPLLADTHPAAPRGHGEGRQQADSGVLFRILKMEWGGEYSFDSSNLDCLLDVLPGELEFRQILSDLDEKIKKNSSSIEKCLKDLQLDINEICTDEVLQSTTDCIQWLNNCNFSSLRPSSTDHGELLEFLKTL